MKLEYDRLDELISALARPIFVYRMAAGVDYYPESSPLIKSAKSRRANAKAEIHELIMNYSNQVRTP